MSDIVERDSTEVRASSAGVPAAITPMQMISIAVQDGADLDRIERLMDLQERWEARESEKAFAQSMADFRALVPIVEKGSTVSYKNSDGTYTEYKHASLADVSRAIDPILADLGLSYRWETQQGNGGVSVTCTITHRLGHKESTSLHSAPDSSGGKNAIQQIASSVTYLKRYTRDMMLGITTEDFDDDGRGADQPEWLDEIKDMISRSEFSIGEICKMGGVPNLPALNPERIPMLRKKLEASIAKKQSAEIEQTEDTAEGMFEQ